MNQNNITSIILAGGKGTRLKSVVSDYPKVLAKVADRPFITYLLDQLLLCDIKEVILCTGYKSEIVEQTIGSKYKSINIIYSKEEKPLGTAGAIKNSEKYIKTDYLLVMNGDSYLNIKIDEFIKCFFKKELNFSIVLTKVEDTLRYGRVELGENLKIKSFNEKGISGAGFINAGIYLFKTKYFDLIDKDKFVSIENDFFPEIIKKIDVIAYPLKSEFIDIGTPESLLAADLFLKKMIESQLTIH